jgi:ABC-2 type transport system permease protein
VAQVTMSLVSVWIVYGYTSDLNGWTRDQLLVVIGCFFCVGAVVVGVFHYSLASFTAMVRTGTLDYQLLRPVDAQVLSVSNRVSGWWFLDFSAGIGIVAWGVAAQARTAQGVDAASLVLAPIGFLIGITALAGVWMCVSYLVFWTINMQGVLYALDELFDSVRWPLGVFPVWLRAILTFVFPAGLAVTIPAATIVGTSTWTSLTGSAVLALTFIAVARIIWRRGVARYEGASA